MALHNAHCSVLKRARHPNSVLYSILYRPNDSNYNIIIIIMKIIIVSPVGQRTTRLYRPMSLDAWWMLKFGKRSGEKAAFTRGPACSMYALAFFIFIFFLAPAIKYDGMFGARNIPERRVFRGLRRGGSFSVLGKVGRGILQKARLISPRAL
jgi:hypothetical protein